MKLKVTGLGFGLFFIIVIHHFSCDFNPHLQGKWLYDSNCASCHMEDGSGLRELIPSMVKSPYLTENNIYSVACMIRYGIKKPDPLNPEIEVWVMPPLPELTNTEIANILNYIGNHFENSATYVHPTTLDSTLENCPNEAVYY